MTPHLPSIEVVGLCIRFGGVVALDDVSLFANQPGVVALVGPNGCGKSTLLHVLSGFIRPDRGHCRIGPLDCSRTSPRVIGASGVARTFQQPRVLRSLSVIDNALLAAAQPKAESLWRAIKRGCAGRDCAEDLARCRSMLEDFDLGMNLDMPSGLLSYGQQRLLGLVLALTTKPRVLLLDEPSAGISAKMMHRVARRLCMEGQKTIILMAEHDRLFVDRVASRVITMQRGRIVDDVTNSALCDP